MQLNINPYYDDFDRNKNFLRVLFNPATPVQARELTTAQTILQNQISSFADHIFKDNSPVVGAAIKVNFEVPKLEIQGISGSTADNFLGKNITGSISGATAKVVDIDSTSGVLFLEYTGGTFIDGVGSAESILSDDPTPYEASIVEGSIGNALFAHCEPGIVYSGGNFIVVQEQKIKIDSKTNIGNYEIGFLVNERIVTANDDSSLFEPAQGTFNFNAPGADRLNTELLLRAFAPGTAPDAFFSLVVVNNSAIIKSQTEPNYADIMNILARRTYDQAGSYTVNEFPIRIEDSPISPDLMKLSIEPGKAYVLGFEQELQSSISLDLPRSRGADSIKTAANVNRYVDYGPYVDIAQINGHDDISGIMSVSTREIVTLHPSPNGVGAPLSDKNGIQHELRISAIDRNPVGELRIYFADAEDKTDLFVSAKSIKTLSGAWANIETYANGLPIVGGKNSGIPIIVLDNNEVAVKAVTPLNTNFRAIRTIKNLPTNAAGSADILMQENDTDFVPYSAGGLVSIVDSTTGIPIVLTAANYVENNNSGASTLTITGLPINGSVDVTYKVDRQRLSAAPMTKSKTIITESNIVTGVGDTELILSKEDGIEIISIIEDPNGTAIDITPNVVLDGGARDYYYDFARVKGVKPNQVYTVTYAYYSHVSTNPAKEMYFSADSYIDADGYDNIPKYRSENGLDEYDLTNCIDFRRKISDIQAGIGVDAIAPAGSKFSCGYEYYVARMDKLFINSGGTFGIKSGIPSRVPEAPLSVADSMTLYTMRIPPYTKLSSKVEILPEDNRRYTMRDIGDIATRVKNLEEFTSLNALERRANEHEIVDVNGLGKFKNGIFVDDFSSFKSSDISNPDYRATIDPAAGEMRCPFNIDAIDMNPLDNVASAITKNIRLHENTATLTYNTVPFISQPKASKSINVNPYAVFNWTGEVKLIPESDIWVDVVKLPIQQVTVGEPIETKVFTEWGSWNTAWLGTKVSTSSKWSFLKKTTTTTTTNSYQTSRSGIKTVIEPTIKTYWNERLVSRETIPFMRKILVTFKAVNMRPGIKLGAKFDSVDVTANCRGHGDYGDSNFGNIKTDAAGKCTGEFQINEGTFTTGAKEFKLFDLEMGEDTSVATAEFLSSGTTEYYQGTITTVHGSKTTRTNLTQSYNYTTTSKTTKTKRYLDPIAQTFIVNTPENSGVYIKDIDLFFKSKDDALPVSVHIVEVENGVPTQNIVPFSLSQVDAADVQTSINSSAPTKFVFSDPVYLQDSTEYAIIVTTNSTKYEVFHSTMGENDLIDGKGIAKQPYAGVMFTSQNASTWTPDQNSDLKFTISKCEFATGIDGQFDTSTKLWEIQFTQLIGGFERGAKITSSSGGTATVVEQTPSSLIVASLTLPFIDGDIISHENGISKATQVGQEVPYTRNPLYATTMKFNSSVLEFEGTNVRYEYSIGGSIFAPHDGISEIVPSVRTLIDGDTNSAENRVIINTSNKNISPIISLGRSNIVCVDTDDNKYISYTPNTVLELTGLASAFQIDETVTGTSGATGVVTTNTGSTLGLRLVTGTFLQSDTITGGTSGATDTQVAPPTFGKFKTGEEVIGTGSGAKGIVVWDTGSVVYLASHNRINFNNAEEIVGQYSGTRGITSAQAQESNFGTYITVPVNLVNPSDDIRVLFDANVPSGASLDVSFNAAGYISKYVNIYSATIGDPSWSVGTSPLNGLEQEIVGKEVTVYDVTNIAAPTIVSKAIATKVTGAALNLQSISDPLAFTGTQTTTNDYFYTSDVLPGAFTDWAAGAYLVGDYVRHNDLMWRAVVGTSQEPGRNAADWALVPGVFAQDKVIEDTAVKWRPMRLESVPKSSVTGTTEYVYLPDEHILNEFTTFSIKIDIRGSDVINVPRVSNFRAIAAI